MDFTSYLNTSENNELDYLNHYFTNCNYVNNLNKKQSFLIKYQLCLGQQVYENHTSNDQIP